MSTQNGVPTNGPTPYQQALKAREELLKGLPKGLTVKVFDASGKVVGSGALEPKLTKTGTYGLYGRVDIGTDADPMWVTTSYWVGGSKGDANKALAEYLAAEEGHNGAVKSTSFVPPAAPATSVPTAAPAAPATPAAFDPATISAIVAATLQALSK